MKRSRIVVIILLMFFASLNILGIIWFFYEPSPEVEKKELIFESLTHSREPGLHPEMIKEYYDSCDFRLSEEPIRFWIRWTVFRDSVFPCLRVGDVNVFTTEEQSENVSFVGLDVMPCNIDWFTGDSQMFDELHLRTEIDARTLADKSLYFKGSLCTIDGKGRLKSLLDLKNTALNGITSP